MPYTCLKEARAAASMSAQPELAIVLQVDHMLFLLQVISMEGFGCDAYLHLNRLGNVQEPLP